MSDSSPKHRLLTYDEVIAALRSERDEIGLTETAKRYSIAPQQICDVLAARKQLSKRMVAKLSYKVHRFYEKQE